jgi:hypothetical protein
MYLYVQRGPKKCAHSLIVNIFGTKWHVVTILGRRESVIMCVRSDHHQRPPNCWANYGCQCVWCDGCTWFLVARSVWLASNLSRIWAVVWRVGGRVPKSFCHCRTSLLFSYFQYHFNTALRCSKDNLSAIVAAVYCSQCPRGTTFTDIHMTHVQTLHYIPRKNCNYMSLCSKDIDYQRVSTFFRPLCIYRI